MARLMPSSTLSLSPGTGWEEASCDDDRIIELETCRPGWRLARGLPASALADGRHRHHQMQVSLSGHPIPHGSNQSPILPRNDKQQLHPHPTKSYAPHPRSSPLQARRTELPLRYLNVKDFGRFGVHMAHQGIYIPPSDAAQQYYPNPYPHSPALIQPHPSSNAQQHGPNQLYPSLARPSSSFMPPPSTLPEDVNKWRNLQPQRPSNLWPRGLTEEQRPFQDRYPQQHAQTSPINPYYAQQPTSTTAAAVAPTAASFTSPSGSQLGQFQRPHTQSPASTFPSAPPMTAPSLPPASPIKPEAFTPAPAAPAPAPESTFQEPKKPSAPQPVNTQQQPAPMPSATGQSNPQTVIPAAQSPTAAAPSPLEAARVTALLEINRLLLYSIFAIQTPPKPAAPDSSSSDATKSAQPARPSHQTNPHYTDYMRRLQSNLAYLACIADRPHKPQNPIPPFPAIMETPAPRKAEPEAEGDDEREKELRVKYESLKELWPDWKGDVKKA